MTINFKDGLDYDDLLQIFHAVNPLWLDPGLRSDLDNGVNALLAIDSMLNNIPPPFAFVLQMLPFPPGWRDKLASVVRLAKLGKGLIDA